MGGGGKEKEPTRLIMKTKYVCHNLLSTYVNFHYNRTIRANILLVKFNSRGGLEKEPLFFFQTPALILILKNYLSIVIMLKKQKIIIVNLRQVKK